MKYKLLTYFGASLLAVFSSLANAGSTRAEVERVLFYDGGNLVYVYPKGGVDNPPACHDSNSGGDYYSFSVNRSMANEYISGLLAAQARKVLVTFWGKDSCIDQNNSETLSYFRIEK